MGFVLFFRDFVYFLKVMVYWMLKGDSWYVVGKMDCSDWARNWSDLKEQ